jgi:hypothetical protein
MNLVKNGPTFFLIGGIILVACGALQLLSRRKEKGASRLSLLATPGGLRILLFVIVGMTAILMGLEIIPVGPQHPPVQGH